MSQRNIAVVLLVFISAIFLRFYRLADFVTFLSDQGRDAVIVKRIITLQHLPAIGASSSVGQVYLGPFYYYLIAPFLLLFNFNPIGLAFAVVLFSIIGIYITYVIVKKEFDARTAFLFLLFTSFSYVNISASRFSWNPNLLPFFSFITLYFFYKFLTSEKILYALLFGAFFSFSFQLHYLAALLFFPMMIFSSIAIVKHKRKVVFIRNILISIATFIFFSFPLAIFDVRHNFLNIKNLLKLFTQEGVVSKASFLTLFNETVGGFFNNIAISPIPLYISFFVLLGLLALFVLLKGKKSHAFLTINLVNIFTYLIGFSFLSSARHPHYYHPVYLSFFLILAYVFNLAITTSKSKLVKIITIVFFVSYIGLNIKNAYFLYGKATHQIQQAQKVADFLTEKIGNKPFNIATWPVEFFEDQYLYFLELKGLIPADRAKREITDQMFVLCAKEPCAVIDSPSWNIFMFGKAKIDTIWTVENLKIYKLVHTNK